MKRREEQAFNDGRIAYRDGIELTGSRRRSGDQRAAWLEGYEHERRLDLAASVTDSELAESTANFADLKSKIGNLKSKIE